MTDTLSTTEIKKRSIKGAKWLLFMNGMGMPAAFLIALLLGRISPASLGVYALAQILIGVITTFVVYGGPPVLSVFMPKIPNARDRGRFLFSYTLILLAMMVVVLALFRLFPQVFEFLLQREFDMRNYGWFVLLTIVIIAAETLANAASGLMLIKVTAIARQMMRMVLLPMVAILFFFNREILLAYGTQCILGGFLAGYLAAAIICMIGISREQRFKIRVGWFLPRGFWAFSLMTMMATVFSFLYGNFDRMCVLGINDVTGLGLYQAVLSIAMIVEYVPQVLQTAVLPTFASLLAAKQYDTLHLTFSVLFRSLVTLISVVSLIVMGFSREILGIFGKEYVDYAYLLVFFSLVSLIRAPALPSFAIMTSMEKNLFRFCQSLMQIMVQGALTLIFMSRYGVTAIAGAKMLSGAVSTFAGVLYVIYGLGMASRLPLSYKVSVSVGVAMTTLRIWVVPPGWFGSTTLTVACLAVFVLGSRLSWRESCDLVGSFIRPNESGLINMAEKDGIYASTRRA